MKKSLRVKLIVVFTLLMIVIQALNGLYLAYLFSPKVFSKIENRIEEEILNKVEVTEDKVIFEKEIFKDLFEEELDEFDHKKVFGAPIFRKLNKKFFAVNLAKSEIGGVFIGIVIIIIATRIIIKPLTEVTNATTEVAKGNFNIQLDERGHDEVGLLIKNFNQMTTKLRDIEYLRKDFVSSVSHEFKTPITSIQGFIFLLRDRELPDKEYYEYIDVITKETTRLSHLSSNLLMLSQLDNISSEIEKNTYRLDEQLRNAILLLETKWQEKNIAFDIEMDYVEIYSNEELLMQVWINLLDNAIKFSDEDNEIDVKIRSIENGVSVEITDYGQGIEKEQLDKIFHRFYKNDESRSTNGNGLGLAIVKEIIDLIGGVIESESVINQFTSFTVTVYNYDLQDEGIYL